MSALQQDPGRRRPRIAPDANLTTLRLPPTPSFTVRLRYKVPLQRGIHGGRLCCSPDSGETAVSGWPAVVLASSSNMASWRGLERSTFQCFLLQAVFLKAGAADAMNLARHLKCVVAELLSAAGHFLCVCAVTANSAVKRQRLIKSPIWVGGHITESDMVCTAQAKHNCHFSGQHILCITSRVHQCPVPGMVATGACASAVLCLNPLLQSMPSASALGSACRSNQMGRIPRI